MIRDTVFIPLLLFVLILAACSSEPETVEVTRIVTQPPVVWEATRLVQVEVPVTRIVELTPEIREVEVTRIVEGVVQVEEVEVTRLVEFQPQPMPHDVFLELEGSGTSLVTENYQWGYCNKAVFFAEVSAPEGNFLVDLWDADCTAPEARDCYSNLFNLGPYDGEVQGQSLILLNGGNFYLNFRHVPSPPTTWTLAAECQS